MTKNMLKKLCLEWDGSNDQFKTIVASATQTLGLCQRELADEFEVAESTISRWINGVARPHPNIQAMVIVSILKKVSNN